MIAQSVADILGRHVRLAVEGIDRMYLNIYVPQLQSERDVVRFFREHRGQPLPSAALMSPISRTFVAMLERFVVQHEIPLVQFRARSICRCRLPPNGGLLGSLIMIQARPRPPHFLARRPVTAVDW
jgi:hypothetical protein